ncbi:hypothetical protein WKW77_10060 [Variovorax ureilyticus]|uniref:ATPase n=1 Tax=Variovorax ureilyticus TaxID=1836198 RepID=A0ABU8VCL3_9BURK
MTTIDVDRLSVLLERADDARTAAEQARRHLQDAQAELRDHNEQAAATQARVNRGHAFPTAQAQIEADEVTRSALEARVERRRAALPALERSASAWAGYQTTLRDFAQKHGVQL